MKNRIITPIILLSMLSGCATIMGEPTQNLPISSAPSGASYVVRDETGTVYYEGKTPDSVILEKSDGSYFGGKKYTITVSKEGHEPVLITVNASPNALYVGGNILFGGLIGYLVVDPMNGNMYTLDKERIDVEFKKEALDLSKSESTSESTDEILGVLMLTEVPNSAKRWLREIGS